MSCISEFSFPKCFNYFIFRSSRPEVFCKKDVLRNFTKFRGKQLFQSPFFNKVAGLRNTFLNRSPLVAASEPVKRY